MKRLSRRLLLDGCAGVMLAVTISGCASWQDGKESIIHMDAKQSPDRARRLTLVGVKELGNSNVDRATEKFIAAIASDPTYGPAHNNLGLLHYEQGNLYQAVLAFEQAMEFMPSDPIVLYNLALTLESAGKVDEAMDLYLQAVQMAPANPVFLGNLVRLRLRLSESGPDVNRQLQDLVLIETRPDWRRWADRQLALFHNDALDRGPQTPEFDTGTDDKDKESIEFRIEDRVIDLTPKSSHSDRSEEIPESPRALSSPRNRDVPRAQSKPLSIPDPSSIRSMPSSIESLPPPMASELSFQ